jgi:hypothetical protein
MVTVGPNAKVFVKNKRSTKQEEMPKRRSEGDMQREVWN